MKCAKPSVGVGDREGLIDEAQLKYSSVTQHLSWLRLKELRYIKVPLKLCTRTGHFNECHVFLLMFNWFTGGWVLQVGRGKMS